MQNQISRRSLAAGLALAPIATLPALAGESGPSIVRLWDDWRALIPEYLEADAKRDAAEKAMPFWAQPGPGRLFSDGSYRGEIIHAPLDMTTSPPDQSGVCRLVRKTLADCQKDLKFNINFFGDEATARKAYRKGLRKLARVRMAQRAEMRKVGLPELDRARGVALNSMFDAATSILECKSCCPDAIAAKIIIAMWFDKDDVSFERICLGDMAYAVKALQPQLSGRIRADTVFLINRADEDEEA